MDVRYREVFLKDLRKLKQQPIYDHVVDLAFKVFPKVKQYRGAFYRYFP